MASSVQAKIEVAGVDAAMVVFEAKVDKHLNQQEHSLKELMKEAQPTWLIDVVAAYHTLMLVYDIQRVTYEQVQQWLQAQIEQLQHRQLNHKNITVHEFFVCYDPEFGLDLERVSECTGLSIDELIQRHA